VVEEKKVDETVEAVKAIGATVVNLLTRKFILDQKELKKVLVEVIIKGYNWLNQLLPGY